MSSRVARPTSHSDNENSDVGHPIAHQCPNRHSEVSRHISPAHIAQGEQLTIWVSTSTDGKKPAHCSKVSGPIRPHLSSRRVSKRLFESDDGQQLWPAGPMPATYDRRAGLAVFRSTPTRLTQLRPRHPTDVLTYLVHIMLILSDADSSVLSPIPPKGPEAAEQYPPHAQSDRHPATFAPGRTHCRHSPPASFTDTTIVSTPTRTASRATIQFPVPSPIPMAMARGRCSDELNSSLA